MTKASPNSDNRIVHLLIAILVVGVLILYHLFKTTIFEGSDLRAQADEHAIKKVVIEAERGNIFSADKKLLATSMPIYDLAFDPTAASDEAFKEGIDELAVGLSVYLTVRTAKEWKNYITENRQKGDRYINLQRKVTFLELQAIKELSIINLGKYRGGLIYERRNYRKMPLNQIAQRTIGYNNQTNQAGIEGAYSSYLEGENGEQWKQKITKGQWKPIESGYTKEPKNGFDITTTIDTRIQDVAHESLLKTLNKYEADHGCVIVMEVATGNIKAIANLGKTKSGEYKEIRNYAVWESTEPGSTFKLASLMVAMEDGYVDTADIVDTENGIFTIYGKKVKDSNVGYGKPGGYGEISIAEAFRKSSNTGIVKAVYPHYKDNPEDFVDQLYKMGLHKKLGLEIQGEGSPIIPTPEDKNWSGITLPWMAFGYGVSLTPLQTLTFYNAVANDGKMVKPIFVSQVTDHGRVVKQNDPYVLNSSICSQETIDKLKALMEGVVKKGGTASNLRLEDIKLAGKTGTCQLNYGSGGREYQASFAGYFPADDPKYSCIVVVSKPNIYKGYYGNTVAGPVFKAVAEEIYLMTPKEDVIKPYEMQIPTTQKIANAERALGKNYMPSLKGLTAPEAIQVLENHGFNVNVSGNGRVYQQSPNIGDAVTNINRVTLALK